MSGRKCSGPARTDTWTFVPNSPFDRAEDPPREQVMSSSKYHMEKKRASWGCLSLTPTQEGKLREFNGMLSERYSLCNYLPSGRFLYSGFKLIG